MNPHYKLIEELRGLLHDAYLELTQDQVDIICDAIRALGGTP